MPRAKTYAPPSGLNPLEEAQAVRSMFPTGTAIKEIGRRLDRSYSWIVVRLKLLDMPLEVQKYVADRTLRLNDLEALQALPPTEWLQAAHQIAAGDRRSINTYRRMKMRLTKNRVQINRMIERLFDAGLEGFGTRLLAWATGGVSDEQIEIEIRELSENHCDVAVVEISDGNDHSTTENDSQSATGSGPGEPEAGCSADCPGDSRNVPPESG